MKIILSIDGLSFQDLNLEEMPNLKKMIMDGHMLKEVKTIFPSVTWPIHTTVSTGELPHIHGVQGNMFREEGERCYWEEAVSKEEVVKIPTFYDVMNKEGKTIASICWPLTQGAKSIKYNIPEFYSQGEFESGCSEGFFEELKLAYFPIEKYGEWSTVIDAVFLQDELTEQIMEYVLEKKEIDVLMGHFLAVDTMQHYYGCSSSKAKFAIKFVDGLIGKILACLERVGKRDEADCIIFSDHGQADITKAWDLYSELRKEGLENYLFIVDDGGCIHVYLKEEEVRAEVREFFSSHSCVEKVFEMEGRNQRQPQFQIALKEGVVSKEYFDEHQEGATHGYDPKTCRAMNSFVSFNRCKHPFSEMNQIELSEMYKLIIGKTNLT